MSKRNREFECKNNPNDFCNVCGEFMLEKNVRKFTDGLQQSYLSYFGLLPNLNESWTPKFICGACQSILNKWAVGQRYIFIYF